MPRLLLVRCNIGPHRMPPRCSNHGRKGNFGIANGARTITSLGEPWWLVKNRVAKESPSENTELRDPIEQISLPQTLRGRWARANALWYWKTKYRQSGDQDISRREVSFNIYLNRTAGAEATKFTAEGIIFAPNDPKWKQIFSAATPWAKKSRWIRWPMYLALVLLTDMIYNLYTNLEEVPITGRWQFNMLPPLISDFMRYVHPTSEQISEHREHFLKLMRIPPSKLQKADSEQTRHVRSVLNRVLLANQLSPESWFLIVVDDRRPMATATQARLMMISSGLLELTHYDDELATVLGHEIGHNVAGHPIESLSVFASAIVLTLGSIATIATGLTIVKGAFIAAMSSAYYFGRLANSRRREYEADYIGLLLSAEAGYDPSAASRLHKRTESFINANAPSLFKGRKRPPQYRSTHPNFIPRDFQLNEWAPSVMQIIEQPTGSSELLAGPDGGLAKERSRWEAFREAQRKMQALDAESADVPLNEAVTQAADSDASLGVKKVQWQRFSDRQKKSTEIRARKAKPIRKHPPVLPSLGTS